MSDEVEQVQIKGVSLYPSDWATVESVAKKNGISISAALRLIIRDWVRMKAREAGVALQDEEARHG